MSGFHHSGMSGFDASMVYDDDEILTLVKGLEACESTQEAYKYIKKIKEQIHKDDDMVRCLSSNIDGLKDENKKLKDENKALKACLIESVFRYHKAPISVKNADVV